MRGQDLGWPEGQAERGRMAMADDLYGYEFLRAEMGRCDYEQDRVQPVAIFRVPDRRGEARLSERLVEARLATKEAAREQREQHGISDFRGLDPGLEREALAALAELKGEHAPGPRP